MSNITITHVDRGSVAIKDEEHEDGLIIFAGADTYAKGTILARHTGNLKWQLYVKGASSNGNGTPRGVLTNAVEATAAGDVAGRVLIRGVVNEEKLVIDADGDNSNVDATVRDLLRSTGITPIASEQLARFDNPNNPIIPGDS